MTDRRDDLSPPVLGYSAQPDVRPANLAEVLGGLFILFFGIILAMATAFLGIAFTVNLFSDHEGMGGFNLLVMLSFQAICFFSAGYGAIASIRTAVRLFGRKSV